MNKRIAMIGLALMALIAVSAAGASDSLYGNAAAKADKDLTVEDMLLYAAQDEYLARGEYVAIMAKFGEARPFSNIKSAEENHLSWLKTAYAARGIAFPADASKSHLIVPANLKEAFQTGVQAELDNIAMYERFLASPLLKDPKNADLVSLFTELKNASGNHLSAFQNQLRKY